MEGNFDDIRNERFIHGEIDAFQNIMHGYVIRHGAIIGGRKLPFIRLQRTLKSDSNI